MKALLYSFGTCVHRIIFYLHPSKLFLYLTQQTAVSLKVDSTNYKNVHTECKEEKSATTNQPQKCAHWMQRGEKRHYKPTTKMCTLNSKRRAPPQINHKNMHTECKEEKSVTTNQPQKCAHWMQRGEERHHKSTTKMMHTECKEEKSATTNQPQKCAHWIQRGEERHHRCLTGS